MLSEFLSLSFRQFELILLHPFRFVKTLPALRMAKDEYWTNQIQPFQDSFAERDLSTSQERDEVTKRRLLSLGISRLVSTFYSTVVTSSGESEPARPNREIMKRVDDLFPGSMKGMWSRTFEGEVGYNAWTAVVKKESIEGEMVSLNLNLSFQIF